ncbi:adenylate kinase [Strigomonas culicis]|uniref:Adenylate kinase n=1 Tax=Strigomonas culicis TaxID=28005 RepID=S9UUQ0_9TRYP|nr:adenylate kinase [Strigomonas culicis]|eukprot:EPY34647.1 adenylate kinase [Strigomonas culicis]
MRVCIADLPFPLSFARCIRIGVIGFHIRRPYEQNRTHKKKPNPAMSFSQKPPLSEEENAYLHDKHVAEILEVLLRAVLRDRPEKPTEYLHAFTATPIPPHIIIAGPPAGGKGTQCENIKQYYTDALGHAPVHISSGDILRAEVKAKTELGELAATYMQAGKLVPDGVMCDMMKERLAQDDCRQCGWLLDGFPRTREQALALDAAGVIPDAFLVLRVPDEVLVERVVGRRVDPATGDIYHLTYKPPPADQPELLARLEQRADDTPDVLKPRLVVYHNSVTQLSEFYKPILVSIDANRAPDQVGKDVVDVLKKVQLM